MLDGAQGLVCGILWEKNIAVTMREGAVPSAVRATMRHEPQPPS